MNKSQKYIDCNGVELFLGDKVIYLVVTEELLCGLPKEDQKRLKSFVGRETKILNFDDERRQIEIEFESKADDDPYYSEYDIIWVEPECVSKIKN